MTNQPNIDDVLPAEVRSALDAIRSHGEFEWAPILPSVDFLRDYCERVTAERDALRKRIANAPIAIAQGEFYGGVQIYGPSDLAGKRVALVVLGENE